MSAKRGSKSAGGSVTCRLGALVVLTATLGACAAEAEVDPAAASTVFAPSADDLQAVPRSRLSVTEGRVDGYADARTLNVAIGGMRAVISGDTSRTAELAFDYRGGSATTAPLAHGELRRQIGLKLRAQDSCNVVYVMWRVEPTPGVVVSVKHNPGTSRHADCETNGYATIAPSDARVVPPPAPGVPHVLRADLDGRALTVHADGALVWTGILPETALTFDGPAGIRSDNATFDFELRVPRGS